MLDKNGKHRKDCLVHLPDDVEYTSLDGVFIKGMLMEKKGTVVFQHSHEYAHTSLLAVGCVEVRLDNGEAKRYQAPAFIEVLAKVKHKFIALEDNTHVYCIHNVMQQNGTVQIHENNMGDD